MNPQDKWRQDYAITDLFVRNRLGKRPRLVAEQEAAIIRASDTLDADESSEAVAARRTLAIEYTAWAEMARGGFPSEAEWVEAIALVDAADDADVRRRARGGMSIRAAHNGWAES